MGQTKSWNPIAFLPVQTTFWSSAIYIAIFAVLLIVHTTVPSAPTSPTPAAGIDLQQAWLDLEFLSQHYHPWGSRSNDEVRAYLLQRIDGILSENQVGHKTVYADEHGFLPHLEGAQLVTVFANDSSNFTAEDDWTHAPVTLYGESTNVIVYIRGEQDPKEDWWNGTTPYSGPSGVLVNAHYDSVASGYGATDDGVGVVTVLQLISHFTTTGNRPRRGIIALLNNGEENGLCGARNYINHPVAQFAHTFLNLEGAGAGGRATLFRATDAEVTKAYAKSPYPFGTVVSGDGFKRGFIRSGTDYSVFTERLGLRGLDVAFYEPRARYHTNQDGARNTNRNSVWHMLSASLATMQQLTSYRGDEFEGSAGTNGKLDIGKGSDSFYFDLLGRVFAVGKLNTLFALSVALLVAGPIILILLEVLLRKADKWYLFAGKRYLHSSDDDEAIRLHGSRGFFRFPFAFIVATGVTTLLAYLLAKVNPYIVYSSEWAVWAMFLAAWFTIAWLLLAGAANIRPTALHRMFCLLWLYILSWVALVFTTIGEHQFHIASGYFIVVYNFSAHLALLISYLELFALPSKQKFVETALGAQPDSASIRPASRSSRRLLDASATTTNDDAAEPNERSSLLSHSDDRANKRTFTSFGRRRADRDEIPDDVDEPLLNKAYLDEQSWSSSLPSFTWILQFLILVPINIILIGQVALLITSSTHQTPADGNPVLPVYLLMAVMTVLLLLPLTPFLHRFTYHVPTFLFLILAGCLIYNLLAFPFSRDTRMKYYFVQHMDLNSGENNVTLAGLDGYVQDIIAEMPSAAGQGSNCNDGSLSLVNRNGLISCSWHGLPPNVVPRGYELEAMKKKNKTEKIKPYQRWLDLNVTRDGNTATFSLKGLNTKICRLSFDEAVEAVSIEDGASSPLQRAVGDSGSNQVKLFSREWDKVFKVNVTWPADRSASGSGKEKDGAAKGQKGRAWCSWADANMPATIPAYDELHKFEPVWSVATKTADGLMEGFKDFVV
ncbi:Putative peptidase M28 [Septoria linicola]|uniref:Peptide hydrolase n=1 Tax=Septoria linicola TaxID=215465 RepID=A0A9Q9EEA7_9PEZI|nr:Putative peptidase M28 [Septoria linicola]